MDGRRVVPIYDDFSGGMNTQDRLLKPPYVKDAQNFDCRRKGVAEKPRTRYSFTIPASPPWVDDFSDFCVFYMNETQHLAFLADVGETDPMIAVHDGTSWHSFPSSEGYLDDDIEGVIWLPSVIGGIPILRIFPIYPSAVDLDEWRPLKLMYLPAQKTYEKWPWDTWDNGAGYDYRITLDDTNKILQCACNGAAGGSGLQPCVGNGGYHVGCYDTAYRIDFYNNRSLGDVVKFRYNAQVDRHVICRITDLDNGTVLETSEAGVAASVESEMKKADNDFANILVEQTRTTTTQSAELIMVRGLPLMTTSDVATNVTFAAQSNNENQTYFPETVIDCAYDGKEAVRYGFSYETIDGQHSNLISVWQSLPRLFVGSPAKGLVSMDIDDGIFPATSGNPTEAEDDMAKFIAAVNIWRWNDADGKWFFLAQVPRVAVNELSHAEENKVSWKNEAPSADHAVSSYMLDNAYGFSSREVLDWGQALSETIFSFTGGLELEDLGCELAAKAPAFFGRKIFVSNVAILKRFQTSWEPEWENDKIHYSLFDKGESFAGLDYLEVLGDDPDEIMYLAFFGRQMLVVKRSKVVVIDIVGSDEGMWKLVGIYDGGVTNRKHCCETPYGLVWLSEDHIYLWDGRQRIPLTRNIEDETYKPFKVSKDSVARIGYDRRYDKLWLAGESTFSYVMAFAGGSWTKTMLAWDEFWPSLDGRLIGAKLTTELLYYVEALDSEPSGSEWWLGKSILETGFIDLGSVLHKEKLYELWAYIYYEKNSQWPSTDFTLYAKVQFDDGSEISHSFVIPAAETSGEKILRFDVWDKGRVANIIIDSNDHIANGFYDKFRLFRIEGVVVSEE